MRFWKSWEYKNLTIFILSLLIAYLLSRYEPFHTSLQQLGNFGYLGAFIAGALFVSSFTVATGIVVLSILLEEFTPLQIAFIAGLGAVIGDYTIFKFIEDNLIKEIKPIYNFLGGKHLNNVLKTKYFKWSLPILGAIIIASPFPDELGVSLMGLSKVKTYKFLILSFILNSIGIFLILSALSIAR